MTTIISSFVYLPDYDYKSKEKFINLGKKLLVVELPKIIFIDDSIISQFNEFNNDFNHLIPIKNTDLWLYKHMELVKDYKVSTDRPLKDTILFFMLMANKTEWIRQAIELNVFNTTNFVWVDFGIHHVLNGPVKWDNLLKQYNKVNIAKIWNLNIITNKNIYKEICWYFCGGVFGGDPKSLILFADYTRNKYLELIEKGILMWEVNVWYLVYKDHPELFRPYPADHNCSIINNY